MGGNEPSRLAIDRPAAHRSSCRGVALGGAADDDVRERVAVLPFAAARACVLRHAGPRGADGRGGFDVRRRRGADGRSRSGDSRGVDRDRSGSPTAPFRTARFPREGNCIFQQDHLVASATFHGQPVAPSAANGVTGFIFAIFHNVSSSSFSKSQSLRATVH
jgi:hypothetical protein